MESVSLQNRKIYIPQMGLEGSVLFAAAFRAVGIDAEVCPDSDEETLKLGGRYTSGDECYPQKITLGNFFKILNDERVDPKQIAFFLPTTGGPCRFGQYAPFLRQVLRETGYAEVPVIAPSSHTGYKELGERATDFQRIAWRAVVCGDILRKLLLKTRPYEVVQGDTDRVHRESLHYIAQIIATPGRSHRIQMKDMLSGMEEIRNRFREIQVNPGQNKLFIGVVGEIFCRLEDFANNNLVRAVERNGGTVWMANIGEWISYTNFMHIQRLRIQKKTFSKQLLMGKLKQTIQHRDEKHLYDIFGDDFQGYEEAENTEEILEKASPYLPYRGAIGELALSVGTGLYMQEHGVDGIIDISPFTCMNGVVTEAVYPKVSRDHNDLPMRLFYFDGSETNLDRDVDIFLELARAYQRKKRYERKDPVFFT